MLAGVMAGFEGFFGVAGLVIVTPGQDTALVVRNSLAWGRRGGVFTALGVVAGQATWTLATGAGVSALLLASRPAFTAVRYVGAAYLVWLGAGSLVRALARPHREARVAGRSPAFAAPAAFREGLMSALGNPKLAAFFVSLLPQFVPRGGAALPILLGLGLVFCSMTLAWLIGYSFAVGRARRTLERSVLRRALEGALGATLIALGLRVATQRR